MVRARFSPASSYRIPLLVAALSAIIAVAENGSALANQPLQQETAVCSCHEHRVVPQAASTSPAPAVQDMAPTNEMCPVMTDVPAEDSWTTIYRGKLVRFCCNNCVQSFRQNPEKYLGNLPQFNNLEPNETARPKPVQQDSSRMNWMGLALLLGSGLASFAGIRWIQAKFATANTVSNLVPVSSAIVIGLLATFYLKAWQANQFLAVELIKEKAKSEVHLATYYDYGVPPVPDNPHVTPALSKSFYRGNDERSPVLFNGGNYQTARFDIKVQHADGTEARVGDSLSGETLYLQYRIFKPENAPARMYDRKLMDRMFLTRSFEPDMGWDKPIDDRQNLKAEMEDEIWSVRFPLGITKARQVSRFDPATVTQEELARIPEVGESVAQWFVSYRDAGYPIKGKEDLRQAGITGPAADAIAASLEGVSHQGLIYVCEGFNYKGRQLGARFHYGIKYDIRIRDGRIDDGSQIWMGALSRSLKAKRGAIPDNQWLSTTPLPELPDPQNISDKLLGIDDYDFKP